ncbi:MAG: trypsin-like serine protease, partial [Myxococcota bacterium]
MLRRLFITLGFVLAACGAPDPEFDAVAPKQAPIIDGTNCGMSDFPSALAVLVDAEISFEFGPGTEVTEQVTTVVCTGTLIAPDVVLTAAHCVDPELLTGGFGAVRSADYYVAADPDLSALALGLPGASLPTSARAVIATTSHPAF